MSTAGRLEPPDRKRKFPDEHARSEPRRPDPSQNVAVRIAEIEARFKSFQDDCFRAFKVWANGTLAKGFLFLLATLTVAVPEIPLLACPWSWAVYRGARSFEKGADGQHTGKFKLLEGVGDRSLSNTIFTMFYELGLPPTLAARLHEKFNTNALWGFWSLPIPDISEFAKNKPQMSKDKANAFEVMCPPSLLDFLY